MKKKTPEQKIIQKRAAWLERTRQILGIDELTARELLDIERRQGLRLNPLIADPAETLAQLFELGWRGAAYKWATNCYAIDDGLVAVRDSAIVTSGAAFIQNAASWVPVLALNPRPGERILDVCAAPGGKTSHIAAITGNQAHLWANDNSRNRLAKMQANFTRLSVTLHNVTLFDATQLARKLDGQQFDKILLDAPCSGEGLMRLSRDKDMVTWSVAHIKRLQQLQKRIIIQAWELLAPGGTLVYSTCTMAPEENEAVVDYLLRSRRDEGDARIIPFHLDVPNSVMPLREWNGRPFNAAIQGCLRLVPSEDIEAFFVCKLRKSAEAEV
jgi:16S rRNA (cytosine1407-C5)-methyltransferase